MLNSEIKKKQQNNLEQLRLTYQIHDLGRKIKIIPFKTNQNKL
jgi:hypothetical protein